MLFKYFNLIDIPSNRLTHDPVYPTPKPSSRFDNLDEMPTPDTPYGQLFYENPTSRQKKFFKRLVDFTPPDEPVSKIRVSLL